MKRKAAWIHATVGSPIAPAPTAAAAPAFRAYRTGSLVSRLRANGFFEIEVSPPPGTKDRPRPSRFKTRAVIGARRDVTMQSAIIGAVVTRRRNGNQPS